MQTSFKRFSELVGLYQTPIKHEQQQKRIEKQTMADNQSATFVQCCSSHWWWKKCAWCLGSVWSGFHMTNNTKIHTFPKMNMMVPEATWKAVAVDKNPLFSTYIHMQTSTLAHIWTKIELHHWIRRLKGCIAALVQNWSNHHRTKNGQLPWTQQLTLMLQSYCTLQSHRNPWLSQVIQFTTFSNVDLVAKNSQVIAVRSDSLKWD